MSRFWKYFLGSTLAILILVGGGIWGGMELAGALDKRSSVAFRVKERLDQYYNSLFRTETPATRSISTNRLTLIETTVFVPLDAERFAGGISATTDGQSVLLLDRLGGLFHIENKITSKLDVAAPENNVEALRTQLDEGRFGKATVDFKWFRYNDVLHLNAGGKTWLLASYTEWQADQFCFNSALARLELPDGSAPADWQAESSDWEVISRTAPCLAPLSFGKSIRGLEAGGRLAQLDDTTVIWTSGGYERDDFHEGRDFSTALAQDDATDYGKVLEVDILTSEMRALAKGLRNPQGLAIGEDSQIWVTDHGMRAGDELNKVAEGKNFGWPAVTYGTRYNKRPAANNERHENHDGYDLPAAAFVSGIAPGSAVVAKDFHYAWDGDIIIGSFRGFLYRVRMEGDRFIYAEPIEIGVRPRDMHMMADGRIAVWSDDRRLIFYEADTGPDPVALAEEKIAALTPEALRIDVGATFEACLQCHALSEGEHGAGPSLYDICARPVGQSGFEGYSGALPSGTSWTADTIAAYITDPESYAAGTSMAWGGLENADVAREVAQLLCPPALVGQ